jgi:tight adherence protein C
MSWMLFSIYALVFALVCGLSYGAMAVLMPNAMTQRMDSMKADVAGKSAPASSAWWGKWWQQTQQMLEWLSPLSSSSEPEDPAQTFRLRLRFYNAGLHSRLAPMVYLASKTALTFALPGVALLVLWQIKVNFAQSVDMAILLSCAVLGYYLPNAVLAHWVQKYQQALFNSFPDALDLMRVCVQAGLGLDAAIDRVGREMKLSSPQLSFEFELTGLELRAGASRADALRHLSSRIGLEDLDALVVMLIQADLLGTSVNESLQVHSQALRTKRRLQAEETAAKLPVKLLIPLVFCVFPALLTVLLGPAVISIHEILAPTAQAN